MACGATPQAAFNDDVGPDAGGSATDGGMSGSDAHPADGPVCTANTQSDPNNCGICGRSCLEGSCSMGQCSAARLDAGDITGIGDFTVDNLFIYYTGFTTGTNPHRLWKLLLGPAVSEEYLTLFTSPTPLAQIDFDGENFYTAELGGSNGTVKKTDKEPFAEVPLATNQAPITTAATLAGGYVYWATAASGADGGDIKRTLTSNTAPGPITTVSAGTGSVSYMEADTQNMFWVDNLSSLRRAPVTGGPPTVLATGKANFIDIDDDNIYMVRQALNELVSVNKTSGATTSLGQATAGGAADTSYVYAAQTNRLVAVTKAGTAMGTLWSKPDEGTTNCPVTFDITRMKVIGAYVYFLVVPMDCSGTELYNQIYRIARL